MATITTHGLGYPRIGRDRALKRALEAYWREEISLGSLEDIGRQLRREHWQQQQDAGIDWVPTGDFAWYDHVLTMSATLGNIPTRHLSGRGDISLDTLFRAARGSAQSGSDNSPISACEMTKWFNTNYHYLVPEFCEGQSFDYQWSQIVEETQEALALGINAKPVILGPLSYLWLGRGVTEFDKLTLLDNILPAYRQLLNALAQLGVEWVQIDEPILSLDLPMDWQGAFERCYHTLKHPELKYLLASYFGGVEHHLSVLFSLPVAGFHIDYVSAPAQLPLLLDRLPTHKILSVGVINGRNVWRADLGLLQQQTRALYDRIGTRLWLSTSCSLLHCPVDLTQERQMAPDIMQWLAFALQKLQELTLLAELTLPTPSAEALEQLALSQQAIADRKVSPIVHNAMVKQRVNTVSPALSTRALPYKERISLQQKRLKLSLLPTTTIGSFPQTTDIRLARQDYKQQRISQQQYHRIMEQKIAECIEIQEALALDVFVHGEAERNDMVEYFGEQLAGFAFSDHGWVQSYGSRCVKPPIIYGDVYRKQPMTTRWASYAQSLTEKPVKGMLTGPVTMLHWSFIRDDQPYRDSAFQIALALRDEVMDLEREGIAIIQIDEPALREGLPLRKSQWAGYLDWAVEAFKISAGGVNSNTQIHTHMCYSKFNDIIDSIAKLDADVITIETSRSAMALLDAFEHFKYPNGIGPGVYDIHSPNIPSVKDIKTLIKKAAEKIPFEQLWVNPDCGLKTRAWPEAKQALEKMVLAAKILREEHVKHAIPT